MSWVVVEHRVESDVFRLVFAWREVHVHTVMVANPDFDAESDPHPEENPELVPTQREIEILMHHDDVVWATDAPEWEGKSLDEIAAAQRKIVSKMLTRRAAELERAEAAAQAKAKSLGGEGLEL